MVNGITLMAADILLQMSGVVDAGSAATEHGHISTWVLGTQMVQAGGSAMRAAGMQRTHGRR